MAKSKCPGCGHGSFEASAVGLGNTSRNVNLVQCAKCGIVVGALETGTPDDLIKALTRQVEEPKRKVK